MLRKGAMTVFLLMLVLNLTMCMVEPTPPCSPLPTAASPLPTAVSTTVTVAEPEPVIGVDEDWGPEEEPWGDEFSPMMSFSVSGTGVPRTNITWAVVKLLTVKNGVEFQTNVDANGNRVDLDADEDTSIRADTNDQIDVEIGGVDHGSWTAAGLTLNDDLTVDDTLSLDDTASTIVGAQTITPTTTFYTFAPVSVLTLTLSTASAETGDLLIVANIVATTTTVVDTTCTIGGGDLTLGDGDNATFMFYDSKWCQVSGADNS